jgi:hypothetical protein
VWCANRCRLNRRQPFPLGSANKAGQHRAHRQIGEWELEWADDNEKIKRIGACLDHGQGPRFYSAACAKDLFPLRWCCRCGSSRNSPLPMQLATPFRECNRALIISGQSLAAECARKKTIISLFSSRILCSDVRTWASHRVFSYKSQDHHSSFVGFSNILLIFVYS